MGAAAATSRLPRREPSAVVAWPSMWGATLGLALLAAADPVRIGVAVLIFSRPRPILNALAFWLGGLVMAFGLALVVLVALRGYALAVLHGMSDIAATTTALCLQLAVGIAALLIAGRLIWRIRRPAPVADQPARMSGLLNAQSLYVPFLAGVGMAMPWEYLAVLAAVLVSGAAAQAQIGAVLLFTATAFAIVEVPLVSYLATPSGTHAVMRRVHRWTEKRRRHILAGVLAVLGVLLVFTAMKGMWLG